MTSATLLGKRGRRAGTLADRQDDSHKFNRCVDQSMSSTDVEEPSGQLHATALLSLTRGPFIAILSCRSESDMNIFNIFHHDRSSIVRVIVSNHAAQQRHLPLNIRPHYVLTRGIRNGVSKWVAVAVIVLLLNLCYFCYRNCFSPHLNGPRMCYQCSAISISGKSSSGTSTDTKGGFCHSPPSIPTCGVCSLRNLVPPFLGHAYIASFLPLSSILLFDCCTRAYRSLCPHLIGALQKWRTERVRLSTQAAAVSPTAAARVCERIVVFTKRDLVQEWGIDVS